MIVELAFFLLIVTAFNVRREHDQPDDDYDLSHEALKTLMARLEKDVKQQISDDDGEVERVEKTATTTTAVTEEISHPEHVSGDITLRLYPTGMKYALEQVMTAIRHDAIRHRPHTIRTTYHGMDINVDSIQIVDFLMSKLEIERLGESRFRFFTHGGGMRYLGLYSTVYKTTREGQFEALLDDVRINLDVEFHEEDDHITVIERKCSARFEEVLVQLTPTMPSQILNLLRERIQTRLHEKVCPAFLHYLKKIVGITKSLGAIEDFIRRKDESFPLCLIEHERVATRFDSRGVKLSFKRLISREKRSALSNHAEHESPVDEMASVSVTEDYINEMLVDLSDSGNIIFHLHRIPDIQDLLRTRCENAQCLGALVDLDRVTDGSGHLDSRVMSAPRLEIHHGYALLHLVLSTVLSYENRAAHHRIPYLRFDTVLTARVTKLSVEPDDDEGHRYTWTARFEITELEVSNVHSDFEEMRGITEHLEEHLKLHRGQIENLLSTHLNGELPLRLNQHVHLQPQTAVFGHHRVLIPFDFKLEKKLFPAFQFFRTSFI